MGINDFVRHTSCDIMWPLRYETGAKLTAFNKEFNQRFLVTWRRENGEWCTMIRGYGRWKLGSVVNSCLHLQQRLGEDCLGRTVFPTCSWLGQPKQFEVSRETIPRVLENHSDVKWHHSKRYLMLLVGSSPYVLPNVWFVKYNDLT